MNYDEKNGFEQIKVSDKLDDVVKRAIIKGKKHKSKKMLEIRFMKYSLLAASITVIFISSIKLIPVFAEAISNVTMGQSINHEMQFYDKNIGNAIKNGASQHISQFNINGNIKITINNVISDDKNLFIFYTLSGKNNKEKLKNLLLQNLKISNEDDDVILDSRSNYYSKLSPILNPEKEDVLLTFNKKYSCIITSLGDNYKNYKQNQETYGCIQLSSSYGTNIPDELNLKILSLTESYKMSYSKEKYDKFISTFNREPKDLEGNWNFDIKLSQNLKFKKPETYNNIKFSINNTDFNMNYLKIYPTRIETRIELGKNKSDGSQCIDIGKALDENGKGNNKKLPYLVDEQGNKYLFSDVELEKMDSDRCLNMNFQSNYFINSKELYLVVDELDYNDGLENFQKDIDEVRIKIK